MSDKLQSGVVAGSVDVSLHALLRNTSNNMETTGVAAGSVTAEYWRQGGTVTTITVSALGSLNAAHSDGGWFERGRGVYRLDVPDAAFAAGADWVVVTVTVAGSFIFHERFNLANRAASEGSPGIIEAKVDVAQVTLDMHLPARITKNATLNNFEFYLVQSSDHVTPKTGAAVTAQRSIDGGAFASCVAGASEVGSGIYKINLAASDLNGDVITLLFTASGADPRLVTIVTQP